MRYVALLRGINVGGKNSVKMNDLVQLLQELDLHKVKTYIQSGNAVFESDLEEEMLLEMLQKGFFKRFGFESNVLIRSIDEIRDILEKLPFQASEITAAEAADPDVEHLSVYFLKNIPDQKQMDTILEGYSGPDIICSGTREVYLLNHQSIRVSKLAIRTSKVFASATLRNWNTVNKLYELLCSL